MKLLKNIEIESFTSINFVSREAEEVWQPTIQDCSQLVQELELLSVAADQRKCAWRTVKTSEVWQLTRKCLDIGLSIYPIENIGSWGQGFTHKTQPAVEGKPMSTYCVITKKIEYANEYCEAFKNGDHGKQGELLGFPICCTGFFMKNWPEYFDPVWQSGLNTYGDQFDNITEFGHDAQSMIERTNDRRLIELNKDHCVAYSNPILRYIGLRVGFHIPCSFNCEKTNEIANERMWGIKQKKDTETFAMLTALLSMPMEWSLLHGVALIKTPIFYVRANSMPTEEKYTIRLHGDFIPREAATGSDFPFDLKENK